MINSMIRWFVLISSSVLLLEGCGGAPAIPSNSFYRLDIAAPTTRLDAPVLTGTLSVQVGAAIPLYRDRALLHSEPGAETTLQRYYYHYWVDTPPHLLQVELADYLRAAGVAPVVVMPEDGIDEAYRLRLDIDHFEQQRASGGGQVRVGLRLLLTERATGRLILQDHLMAVSAVQGDDFPQLAMAYQQAVAEISGRIVALLKAYKQAE